MFKHQNVGNQYDGKCWWYLIYTVLQKQPRLPVYHYSKKHYLIKKSSLILNILIIVCWNNFHGSLSHHWLNVRCLLLTEGWCYLRDLSSGASFLVWHCSALTGSRVWVPPTESETTNHHKDRNREAVSTEISPSSEIGVQGWHHIEIH